MCHVVWWAIRPKNSAQELLLCVLFFRLVICVKIWCVMWWDVISRVWWDAIMCDVWCGEISPIRPKNSAQQLLLCVLFFRLVMCDVVRCDVCDVVWWAIRPKNSAQELLLCVLFFRLVMCDVVRCDVCDVVWWAIRPKNSAQELLLCVLFFRLVMCDVVRCDISCLVRCDHVWCVMWWDFPYPAQELGPTTSSLCSLLSACNVWCGEMWCLWCGVVSHPAQELGPRTSSLCSLLSACNVWCGEMWYLVSGEICAEVHPQVRTMRDAVFKLLFDPTKPSQHGDEPPVIAVMRMLLRPLWVRRERLEQEHGALSRFPQQLAPEVLGEVMNEWQHAWYKSNEVTMRNHKKLRNAWFAHLKQRCGGTVWAKLLVQYGPGRMSDLLAAVLDARADRVEEQAPIMPVARAAMQQRATMWIVFALGGPRLRDLLVRRSSTCCWSKKKMSSCLAMFTVVRGVTTFFIFWLYCYGTIHCGPWCHDPVRVVIIVCRSGTQICTLWSVASPLKTIFILFFYTVWGLLPG